jgi:hypothetical protein
MTGEPSMAKLAAALCSSVMQAQQILDHAFMADQTVPCRIVASPVMFDVAVEFSVSRRDGARLRVTTMDTASLSRKRRHVEQSRIQLTVEQSRS